MKQLQFPGILFVVLASLLLLQSSKAQSSQESDAAAIVAANNAALADAEAGKWADFDRERATVKAARDREASGVGGASSVDLDKDAYDLIDRFTVKGEEFEVRYFYTLHGNFNTRYAFLHFDAQGHLEKWFQCESDDVDQIFFAQNHPSEAKAGARSFSLDSYTDNGKGVSQGLMKFYSDGEPTYETVRGDVMQALTTQAAPAASFNGPAKN